MKRFFLDFHNSGDGSGVDVMMNADENGEYVLYADVEPIIADRDIEAANLEKLVDLVLAYGKAFDSGGGPLSVSPDDADRWCAEVEVAEKAMLDLAQGLKQ